MSDRYILTAGSHIQIGSGEAAAAGKSLDVLPIAQFNVQTPATLTIQN